MALAGACHLYVAALDILKVYDSGHRRALEQITCYLRVAPSPLYGLSCAASYEGWDFLTDRPGLAVPFYTQWGIK